MKLQEKMFALVRNWRESRMTKREFLLDKAIGLSKFNYWLYKYRDLQNDTLARMPAQSSADDFKSFLLSPEPTETDRQSISMEIVTPSGVRITIYH